MLDKRHQELSELKDRLTGAIAANPQTAELHAGLGEVLVQLGCAEEGVTAYRTALHLKPHRPLVHYNLGCALRMLVREAEAIASFRAAIASEPNFPEAYNNLGNALRAVGEMDDAIASYQHALAFRPNYAAAYVNLGQSFKVVGRLEEAIECFEKAQIFQPGLADAISGKIYTLHYLPRCHAGTLLAESRRSEAIYTWHASTSVPTDAPERQLKSGEFFEDVAPSSAAPIFPEPLIAPPIGETAHRRLKIGYVSPDFRDHVAGFYLLPLIREHDRGRVEVFCYSNVRRPDAITHQFQALSDHWKDISGLNDADAAELIRLDRLDILVDTTLHMGGNRLALFGRKPTPIQATLCGYPGTTGLSFIDYRLTDRYLDPPAASDEDYCEKSIRLADSFWCYEPAMDSPDVGPLPCDLAGAVTFGSLNNFCKINDDVLTLWAGVLRGVPGSSLILLAPRGQARVGVQAVLSKSGISTARVKFVDFQHRMSYLATYRQIDIGLDPFPYNGHTTSLDALYMGVPVVTRVGSTAVGRAGVSQLSNLGLTELIAESDEQFVSIAVGLANDRSRLKTLRLELRSRMRQSPLMDAAGFARNVEQAYRQMIADSRPVISYRASAAP